MELKDAKISKYSDEELLYMYSKVENFIKYLDTSLYFIKEGESLIKFEIPFIHKKYE